MWAHAHCEREGRIVNGDKSEGKKNGGGRMAAPMRVSSVAGAYLSSHANFSPWLPQAKLFLKFFTYSQQTW